MVKIVYLLIVPRIIERIRIKKLRKKNRKMQVKNKEIMLKMLYVQAFSRSIASKYLIINSLFRIN
jgi:hypothetical protein